MQVIQEKLRVIPSNALFHLLCLLIIPFSFLYSIHSNVEALWAQILISSSCCYFVTWLNSLSLLNLNKYILHFWDCSAEASRTCFSSLFYRPIIYTQRILQKLFKIVLSLLDCWFIYGFCTEILGFWTHI